MKPAAGRRMIGIEELDALDLTIWLGRGSDAASHLGCNQSTISRRSNQCLQVFDLRLHRDAEGWPRIRQHDLLQLERQVHQLHRLREGRHLRIDASLLAAPLLQGATPHGWIGGSLAELDEKGREAEAKFRPVADAIGTGDEAAMLAALAAFEAWFAERYGRDFCSVFDRYVPDKPKVDF